MHRSSSLVVIGLLAACGSASEATSTQPTQPTFVNPGTSGVFVSSSLGNDANDGTFSRPLRTLGAAIVTAQKSGMAVLACAETFTERVDVTASVTIQGGFRCADFSWSSTNEHARLESATSPALRVHDADALSLTRFDIVALDVPRSARPEDSTALALEVRNVKNVHLTSSLLRAGKGRDGDDSKLPPPFLGRGLNGAAAIDAGKCAESGRCESAPGVLAAHPGGAGGVGQCVEDLAGPVVLASHPGGNGGSGDQTNNSNFVLAGSPGLPQDVTPATAKGGWFNSAGTNGADGDVGSAGPNGVALLTANGFVIGDGTAGKTGAAGQGGGGGGSGDHINQPTDACGVDRCPPYRAGSWQGAAGAGGGAGGCPGRAATAAGGGGASIALFLVESSATLDDVRIEARGGGIGGLGSLGTPPTDGGSGGNGAPYGHGGAGGHGGRGGFAGGTGHGASGPTYGLVHAGGAPTMNGVTFLVGPGGGWRESIQQNGHYIRGTDGAESAEVKPVPH